MLEFDAFRLKSPMKRINLGMTEVARETMARIGMSNLDDTSVSKLVGVLQSTSIDAYHSVLPLNMASAILDVPTRTLQAALKQEGTSFAKLREQARHKAAKREHLAGRSIGETAAWVGFAQRQTFSEAFSKWQGCPPSVFLSQAHKNA
ncbi:helix-turn-helix domain-containing protein [Aliiruegeria sabulilitoris]|uniref:helix-turn-helix domain-containing protein n=1 Tax=Aliiruegeria sabulilitoris TaxID=1510458 RepID=UPI0008306F4A|nr:helix-turn-helix domain-containing protein [Aliiruegeria sabulilitoris]NDR55393.1 AraC family transcriptional regulator [Pseudoruegeria sp. M32A2M]